MEKNKVGCGRMRPGRELFSMELPQNIQEIKNWDFIYIEKQEAEL